MIVANEIYVNEHFRSGARRDFIRINFKNQVFPNTENKVVGNHLHKLEKNEGNIDFFCLTDNEEPPLTSNSSFLCASGEISINKITKTAFSYYQFPIERKMWDRLRDDVLGYQPKIMLIYFLHLYGKVADDSDENDLSLKVQMEFEKIVWKIPARVSQD
jgi:hypothetical protein